MERFDGAPGLSPHLLAVLETETANKVLECTLEHRYTPRTVRPAKMIASIKSTDGPSVFGGPIS